MLLAEIVNSTVRPLVIAFFSKSSKPNSPLLYDTPYGTLYGGAKPGVGVYPCDLPAQHLLSREVELSVKFNGVTIYREVYV